MSEPPRTTCVKILQPRTRVSGAVGEFIEVGSKRRKQRRMYGVVLQATSWNQCMVSFDASPNPIVLEVASNSLRVENSTAALQPDVLIPSLDNVPQHLHEHAQEMINENIQDQDEEEHLPDDTPESEDVEIEENRSVDDEEEIADQSSKQEQANLAAQHDNNSQQDAKDIVQPNKNPQQETENRNPPPINTTPVEQTDAAVQDEDHEGRKAWTASNSK